MAEQWLKLSGWGGSLIWFWGGGMGVADPWGTRPDRGPAALGDRRCTRWRSAVRWMRQVCERMFAAQAVDASGMTPAPDEPLPQVASRSEGAPIRLLLADDHESIRQTLRYIFDQQPDMEVVGEAADGRAAVEMACRFSPDVMVMDINMPMMTGIEAVRRIRQDAPSVQVIGLSVHRDPAIVSLMTDAGASAYLVKGDPIDELCDTVRRLHQQRCGLLKSADPAEADTSVES